MRHVALVALALLVALPSIHAGSTVPDDCAAAGMTGCTAVPVPDSPAGGKTTYFVYTAVAGCAPDVSDDSCMGRPNAGPLDLAGVVYQDTNPLPGLQRTIVIINHVTYQPDEAVLI